MDVHLNNKKKNFHMFLNAHELLSYVLYIVNIIEKKRWFVDVIGF